MDLLIEGQPIFGRVILAHGAGAGMESPFMQQVSQFLSDNGVQVVRFEFPYMRQRRLDGKKRPPDRVDKLLPAFQEVVDEFAGQTPVFLAGKSMGGRIASMLLEEADACAGFVFGYPFHPLGQPQSLRVDHLRGLNKSLYVFQGERDPMGTKEEVLGYGLPSAVRMFWLADGNHDLKPRVKSGFTQQEHMHSALVEMLDAIKHYPEVNG